jgi:beta-N-acetylhexosaminidase
VLVALVLVVAVGVGLVVVRLAGHPELGVAPTGQAAAPAPAGPVTSAPSAPDAAAPPAALPCGPRVAAMPLRARLAQRLMVGIDPSQPGAARAVVGRDDVGGVFIGGNATTILRGDALAPMRAAAAQPVAVAVDEEGGRVQRIDQLDGSLPSARIMAATMTPAQVRALGAKRGRQLRARGVTMDMAPVVDVDGGPANGAIGDRSFSADPQRVVIYAGAFAAGLREAGVLPVFKHFPGHGRASGDSHAGAVTTPPLAALRTDDLVPYRRLLGGGPAAVMVGHLDVPGLTGGQPASLSPAAYRLLRGQYGFRGLVMTDDLGAMKAITDQHDLPDAVVTALSAGADMALWTSTIGLDTVLDRLEAAVRDGRLPEPEVNQATARVLAAKGGCTG